LRQFKSVTGPIISRDKLMVFYGTGSARAGDANIDEATVLYRW